MPSKVGFPYLLFSRGTSTAEAANCRQLLDHCWPLGKADAEFQQENVG
jgi:hypothetical protein